MKITLANLTKVFPNRNKKGNDVIAVNDFTLDIPDGKLIGLLGPSGCGKSTVLNMLCGLLTPTSGRIYFGDEDVTDVAPEDRGVGMVFQNYALYPHLTVRRNIRFPLENRKGADKLSKAEMEARVMAVAKLVQLEDLLDRKPKELSGGQQQRVAIARALIKEPKVLLMDEPLSNLDARLRLQTREEIRRIQKQTGITTIFVTHDQEEAMSISDMIVVMKDGAIHQVDAPQNVYDSPIDLFVAKFLGTPPIHIFRGNVSRQMLSIGDEAVLPVPGVDDGEYTVGIRPEGFEPAQDGKLTCDLQHMEVMGRDVSLVCSHDHCESGDIRAIVNSKIRIDLDNSVIRFNLEPDKVHLFDMNNGKSVRF
jgi:multiple sugar transport system ATP-binding protein